MMRWIEKSQIRLQMLFRRGHEAQRLDDELNFHLDRQIAENVAAGMTAEEARYSAMRSFGNPTELRDKTRETWSWTWLDLFLRDVRYGIRTLARTPGFAIIAMLVMALGIGSNVALFTVVHSVVMKPWPFKDPDRLVRLYEADAHGAFRDNSVAGGTFDSWQKSARTFEQMAIMGGMDYNLSGSSGQLPEQVYTATTSWNLFPMLGVEPALGRFFTASDDRPDANATVVLTWGLWKRRYGGDPHLLGQTVLLNAKPYTVIGVLPEWFTYPETRMQLWTAAYHEEPAERMQTHDRHNFDVLARLKPGVSIQQATAELITIQQQNRKQFPDGPVFDAANIRPIVDADVHEIKTALYTLLGATACLLLIACLNIANLLVARSASRRKESAIRTALGGSRARLVREQVIESTILSIAGGGLGILLAYGMLQWLIHIRPDIPRASEIHMDGIAALFAVGVVLVCGLLSGLIPALSLDDKQLLRTLQESSRAHSAHGRVRLRRILLSFEVGLTVVLLIGAGLLLKSYSRLRSVDPGCATRNVLTMSFSLPEARYSAPSQVTNFYEQLLDRIRSLPGVEAATLATAVPAEGHHGDDAFSIQEHPPLPKGAWLDASVRHIDPGFFTAMQIPLLQGRSFLPNERDDNTQVVVVNQALIRKYFPAEEAIGKHIVDENFGPRNKNFEIVGIVADTREKISEEPHPTMYYPLYRGTRNYASLAVRSSHDPANLALPVQKIFSDMDRNLPVADVLTMDQIIGKSTLNASFNATLLLVFAVLSLVLAAVGLFGVLSYIVAQRTGEIGIRIALGAQRGQVMSLMLNDGLRPALFGMGFGLLASIGLSQLIQSMLYGTKPFDLSVFVLVTMTLLVVSALACLAPAWRASRLDPVQALRTE